MFVQIYTSQQFSCGSLFELLNFILFYYIEPAHQKIQYLHKSRYVGSDADGLGFATALLLKAETFVGRNFHDFCEFRKFLRKFFYLEHANLRIRESFFPQNSSKVAIYSGFAIAFFKASPFVYQKVELIYRALSELLLFFLKHDKFVLFFVGTIIVSYLSFKML